MPMPLYEYECNIHGSFEEIQPMQRSGEPENCPVCGEPSPRVLSPTRISRLPAALAAAHARNEKSRHAPELRAGSERGSAARQGGRQALQMHRGARPWVIEHG
jgi:putative FmdB family regulatory protein